jgi:geranylgeranyl diphosphate synthase type I
MHDDRDQPQRKPSQVTEAQPVPASPLDAEDLRARVDRALAALLDQELTALGFLGADAGPVTDALTRFAMEGGKRLRPAFVYWGYRGAGGEPAGPDAEAAIRASCSVELLHICALIHDDIMDGSEVRRGRRRPGSPRRRRPAAAACPLPWRSG